jgi:hypothetical protein
MTPVYAQDLGLIWGMVLINTGSKVKVHAVSAASLLRPRDRYIPKKKKRPAINELRSRMMRTLIVVFEVTNKRIMP